MAPQRRNYAWYRKAFEGIEAPFAFVDLDAMWSNSDSMLELASKKPIRIASKSIRSRPLIHRILDRDDRYRGIMTFTLPETLWLAETGLEDLLLAYPTVDREALAQLAVRTAARPETAPILTVDSTEQLDLIESVLGSQAGPVRICIDLDAGWWTLGDRLKVGAKRSPVHDPADAVALAREISRRDKFELVALLAYESQIAGVGDSPPGNPVRGELVRWMQRNSIGELAARRAAVVEAVREVAEVEIVNGGGTGSLDTTSREKAITEVTAGSGFFAPALFDHYSALSLTPAAAFAIPVVRRPGPGVVTALGGGYLASGGGGRSRLPVPWLPAELKLDREEGAGEVQTPLSGAAADRLALGDPVFMRHAKAGELCERFDSLYLLEGDEIVDEIPTYRGEGKTFL